MTLSNRIMSHERSYSDVETCNPSTTPEAYDESVIVCPHGYEELVCSACWDAMIEQTGKECEVFDMNECICYYVALPDDD